MENNGGEEEGGGVTCILGMRRGRPRAEANEGVYSLSILGSCNMSTTHVLGEDGQAEVWHAGDSHQK